jgi:hypothetical protein
MKRRSIVVAGIALAVLVGLSFGVRWLFGSISYQDFDRGTVTVHRHFGRYTRVTYDKNNDGQPYIDARFSWSQPYTGEYSDCGHPWTDQRQDRNLDGRWDTWLYRQLPNQPCVVTVKVDLDNDGLPDHEEQLPFSQALKRVEGLDEERGFRPLEESLEQHSDGPT